MPGRSVELRETRPDIEYDTTFILASLSTIIIRSVSFSLGKAQDIVLLNEKKFDKNGHEIGQWDYIWYTLEIRILLEIISELIIYGWFVTKMQENQSST